MYYKPELVHSDWTNTLTISDSDYDALESEYCDLAKALNLPRRLSPRPWNYPEYEGEVVLEFPKDTLSGKLVLERYGKPRTPKI